ncbi:hypothetical protein [Sphingomonas sp. Leaf4]|uniref:hypothetical protein n=1 Tax=Sphingomonas sp. Leaf4 TaxID=2876553 RepID=UPI001E4085D6|nr:hypothetical protein [Sphingomonas sp. Leaf4]
MKNGYFLFKILDSFNLNHFYHNITYRSKSKRAGKSYNYFINIFQYYKAPKIIAHSCVIFGSENDEDNFRPKRFAVNPNHVEQCSSGHRSPKHIAWQNPIDCWLFAGDLPHRRMASQRHIFDQDPIGLIAPRTGCARTWHVARQRNRPANRQSQILTEDKTNHMVDRAMAKANRQDWPHA